MDDSLNYYFADINIAQGNSSGWSFPNWPSHLDHILVTNELFNMSGNQSVQTIKIDEYLNGGWNEYDQNISDHRPVGIKLLVNIMPVYDINDDGVINEFDIEMLTSFIINGNGTIEIADINYDNVVNIIDLLILSDFFYGRD